MIHLKRFAAPALLCLCSLMAACDDTGDTGAAGAKGAAGAVGTKGAAGAPGSAGAQGAQGVQGMPGMAGIQGVQGIPGVPGPAGAQGPAGAGSVGAVYTIPGSGGTFGGGYLSLNTPSNRAQLQISCNYGSPGDNEAYFFAGNGVTAGQIAVLIQFDGQPMLAFNDLAYNGGGQDRATVNNSPELGAWPWQSVFIANDGGTLTRWDVTVTGSSGGNCTAVVYASNGGGAQIVQP